MTDHIPTLESLFQQLGLPSDQASIDQFLSSHSPLPNDCRLADAPFWDESQAAFLKEKILEDGVWAQAVDKLNLRLRA
ncbi:DUF2789 family protein [Ectopseudomonas mendocina]|uniref:DUF2789 family protein n=1 Tax=Ectopseudomonas mendocina TaxID=300 RepID=A0ABZ2RKV8_ECTME